jgi:hypothetical protein
MNHEPSYWNTSRLSKSKGLLLAITYFLFTGAVLAQKQSYSFEGIENKNEFGRFRYIEVKGHTGYHLYAGELLIDEVSSGYGALEIRYGWQPKDRDHWTSRYGYASYGVGYYSGFIGNPRVLGKPNALFGFMTFPLSAGAKRYTFEISQSAGITYNLEPFNSSSNPVNDAIGSTVAVYFNLSFGGSFKWTREMDLLYGIDFTHFSNGRITTPNYGYNMYGLNLGLRYHYNTDQRYVNSDPYSEELLQARFKRPETEKSIRLHESSIEIYLAGGSVQNEEDKGSYKRYGIFSGALDYRFKFNSMHAVTGGLDLFYDASLEPEYPETRDQFLYGIHGGYDFMFGPMSIRMQIGTYLTDDRGKSPTYMRVGFRYDINDWLFTQIAVKTRNTSRADWAELGFGFRPFKW